MSQSTIFFHSTWIFSENLDEGDLLKFVSINFQLWFQISCVIKAELLLLKLIHLFAREVLLVKRLEIEETIV